ncbi:MAG TPA: hypothetical protein VHX65_01080 [Pirellulales bacterium]|jgi:hypothetical protein|nr:hypothetical protein [Pirellulales bacterium]
MNVIRFRGLVVFLGLTLAAPRCPAASRANSSQPATSGRGSSGATDISVSSPFTSAYDNYITVGVKSLGGKLRLRISTGPGYVRSRSLISLVDGSASSFHDTDSAQAAIRWTNDQTPLQAAWNSGGTNAREPSPTRSKAADWTRDAVARGADGKLLEVVHWDAAIPSEARHVDVVLVFTDVLSYTSRDHDDRTAAGRKRGDAPATIGSWSGERLNGKWTFKINRSDLTPPNRNAAGQKEYPTQAQIDRLVGQAQRIVKSRTGFLLVKRDFGNASSGGGDRKWDTGFDIVPAN